MEAAALDLFEAHGNHYTLVTDIYEHGIEGALGRLGVAMFGKAVDNSCIADFNDDPDCEHAEVIAAFDAAINAA